MSERTSTRSNVLLFISGRLFLLLRLSLCSQLPRSLPSSSPLRPLFYLKLDIYISLWDRAFSLSMQSRSVDSGRFTFRLCVNRRARMSRVASRRDGNLHRRADGCRWSGRLDRAAANGQEVIVRSKLILKERLQRRQWVRRGPMKKLLWFVSRRRKQQQENNPKRDWIPIKAD